MTIWSTISSTLHHTPSSSTSTEQQQPPGVVPPPHPSVGPVASTSTSATDEPSSSFEFYDPRGLATKVRRSTRSRSNTPQVETESSGNDGNNSNKVQPIIVSSSPGNTFIGRRDSSSVEEEGGSVIDSEGDTRMRIGSEEPTPSSSLNPSSSNGGIPIPNHSSLPTSPTPSTPLARSPPTITPATNGGVGGIPLTLGGIKRQPSLRNQTQTQTQTSHSQRNQRQSSAPPTSQPYQSTSSSTTTAQQQPQQGMGMGMSPAASFLSSFSPTSAPTSSSYNSTNSSPNPGFANSITSNGSGGGNGNGRRRGFDFLLPPKGDQIGFVLPLTTKQIYGESNSDSDSEEKMQDEEEEEERGEWVLGKELGSGQMGIVREVIWRPTSSTTTTTKTTNTTNEKKKKRRRGKIAVKIVRKDLFSSTGTSGGGGGLVGNALEAFGLSPRGGAHPSSSSSSSPRPLPGSRATSFQLSLPSSSHNNNNNSLRNPSKDRLLNNGGGSGFFERNRSTSSPIKPPSQLFLSSTSSASGSSLLSPIEQSPLPSPGLGEHATSPSSLEIEPSPEQTLLLQLLNRELTLWSHITSTSTHVPHSNIVSLLSTFETKDFQYVFMPNCDGGSLLNYLNSNPQTRDEPPLELLLISSSSSSNSNSSSSSSSRSRDRAGGSSSSSRGRSTLPRSTVKPRNSLPFASTTSLNTTTSPSTSISPSPSASSTSTSQTRTSRFLSPPTSLPQERALSLESCGKVFGEIVEGLKWLHLEKGVVHKDFKLENLLSVWEEQEQVLESSTEDDDDEDDGDDTEVEGEGSRGRSKEKKKKSWKRVWKLADFGLSELIPQPQQQQTTTQQQQHQITTTSNLVQPLSSLARGGSLRDRTSSSNKHSSSQLSSSVGPSSSTTTSSRIPPPSHHSSILVPPSSESSSSALTTHLHPIGSLPYSSPESLKSPIPILDPSVDVWALGCCLYAMVEGVLPIWDEWEFRLRTRLIKGDWELPTNLTTLIPGESEESKREKGLVMEVLKGCLEKQVDKRWDIEKIYNCDWLKLVRNREEDKKIQARVSRRRRKNSSLKLNTSDLTSNFDSEMKDSVQELPPPSPARGRPSNLRPLLPPLLSTLSSCSSSAASSTPGSTSTSRSSSSTNTNNRTSRPSPVLQDTLSLGSNTTAAALRRPSRSTSRSSAYSHQGVDSRTQLEEFKERGRSQRRLRWDEEKETSRVRRRSESRDALEGARVSVDGLNLSASSSSGTTTGRGRSSSSTSSRRTSSKGGKSRERGGGGGASGSGNSGERLETVQDEPY